MRKITEYQAIDGQIFDEQIDCKNYENKITENNIIILNYDNEQICYSEIEYAWAIKILNVDALELIRNSDEIEAEHFQNIGIYIWDEMQGHFIYIGDTLQAFKELE